MYHKTMGRLTVEVNDEGAKMHDYAYGCKVRSVSGWNVVSLTMSVEELRDLRYLVDRAIAAAEERRK